MGGKPHPSGTYGENKLSQAWITEKDKNDLQWDKRDQCIRWEPRLRIFAKRNTMKYLIACGVPGAGTDNGPLAVYLSSKQSGAPGSQFRVPAEALKNFAKDCGFWSSIKGLYQQATGKDPLLSRSRCIVCHEDIGCLNHEAVRAHIRKYNKTTSNTLVYCPTPGCGVFSCADKNRKEMLKHRKRCVTE